ncbi:TPA_asm: hypothetical protein PROPHIMCPROF_38 [Mycobacterium phage McProf]|nr:Uncharacterised protein [Mycolicibacterium phlei]DAZ90026.1 TPA_asm: hypothetical protein PROPHIMCPROF_38 [Mycobacterium phage McProf]
MVGVTFGALQPGQCALCSKGYSLGARVTYRSHDEEPVHVICAELADAE